MSPPKEPASGVAALFDAELEGAGDATDYDRGRSDGIRRARELVDGRTEKINEKITERTHAVMDAMRVRGEKTGGDAPFGFKLASDGRMLEPVGSEQSIIAEARREHERGMSYYAIAKLLNSHGRRSRAGSRFHATQVRRMLARRPVNKLDETLARISAMLNDPRLFKTDRGEYQRLMNRCQSMVRAAILVVEFGIDATWFDWLSVLSEAELRTRMSDKRVELPPAAHSRFASVPGLVAMKSLYLCSKCRRAALGAELEHRVGWSQGDLCRGCTAEFDARESTPPDGGIDSALRIAKRLGLEATLTIEQWDTTVEHFGNRCAYCAGPWSVVEHATPTVHGGGTTVANCLPACQSCNILKLSLSLEQWLCTKYLPSTCSLESLKKALAWLQQLGRPMGTPAPVSAPPPGKPVSGERRATKPRARDKRSRR
jgi:hypothetical protein